jgi:DUF218 domain
MESSKKSGRQGFGLLKRREVLLPTLRGWLFLLLMSAGLIFAAVREVHPFLATIDPVSGGALIVEGWLPAFAFEKVIAEFNRNQYSKLYVTGGPIEQGSSDSGYITYAERGAAILRGKGVLSNAVQAVPAPKVDRDRTYASAVALKSWLLAQGIAPKSYHVMTMGTHARRSRLLFQKALGEGAVVGITAIDDPGYDPKHWWNTSAGVRTVIGETIAYCYARLIF